MTNSECSDVRHSSMYPSNSEKKFNGTSLPGIFLGYDETNPTAYIIYDTTNNKIVLARTVEFFEDVPGNASAPPSTPEMFYFNRVMDEEEEEEEQMKLNSDYNKEGENEENIGNTENNKLNNNLDNTKINESTSVNKEINNEINYNMDQNKFLNQPTNTIIHIIFYIQII